MRKRLGTRVLRLVAVSGAILAGATGVAFATGTLASIVGSDGAINGCYQKVNGQLRVVAEGEQCRPSELPVSWSQQGPEGLQGEQGPPGEDGVSVTSSALPVGDANCPGGGVALTSASGTDYVCNGAPGEQGEQGPPGADGVVGCGLEQRIKAALPSFQLSQECVPPPQEGDVCDDGDGDTYDDRIRDGVCAGLPIPDCDDGDPNTIDTFDASTGACTNTPIQQPSAEVCDGVDNDLDGVIDNVPPQSVPNGTVVCASAAEQLICNAGFANGDGNLANGCEINLLTDPANCGAIGNVVSIPHATGACVNGQAVLVACHPGWHDANGSIVDGCELHEDAFEPNDSIGAARSVPWGTLSANIAPAGNEDWFRYFADCFVFNPCDVRFQASGGVIIQVYEDGTLVGQGSVVNVGLRQLDHEYRVRVTAPGFVPFYTLNAQS